MKITTRKRLIMGILFLTWHSHLPAKAADKYVDGTASQGGDGSISHPFQTIQRGFNSLKPGDTLLIRKGVYSENLKTATHGTPSLPITVKAFQGEPVVITGDSGERLQLAGNFWVFKDLSINQNQILADAVEIKAHDVTMKNLDIWNGRREGISIENAYSITIEDSSIHDFMWIEGSTRKDAHCIMIDTSHSANIHDINIFRNTIERCSGDGIQIFGSTGQAQSTYAKDIHIVDNVFHDGTTDTQLGLTENALDFKAGDTVLIKNNVMTGYKNNKTIVVQKGSRNFTIQGNSIQNGDRGIELRQEGGASFIQENHSVIRNLIAHMESYALKVDGVKNLTVLHNTLVDIGGNAFLFDSTLGKAASSVEKGMVKNNLMYGTGSGRIKDPIFNVALGYNGWFQASANDLSHSTDITGLNPGIWVSGSKKYHLQPESPAIDVGVPVGENFLGTAPDLGAWEFDHSKDTIRPVPPPGIHRFPLP